MGLLDRLPWRRSRAAVSSPSAALPAPATEVRATKRVPKAAKGSLREPYGRALLDWTPGLRRAALAMADSGDMRLAADLCEAMLGDDRVAGCVSVRTRGLFGLPLDFEAGTGRRKRAAVKALEADEDFWAMFPEADLANFLTWAVLLGIGVAHASWVDSPNGRMLARVQVWHPRNLRFDWEARHWLARIDGGSEVVVTPGEGGWIVCTPYGDSRPWAYGLWRALSLCWLAKYFSAHDWSTYNEVHGHPILSVESPEGAQEDDWQSAAEDLANIGSRTTMAMPPGYKLVVAEAKARGWNTFSEQIEWADKAIAILLLGQNLTTDVSGGSLAAAEVHNQIRGDIIRADAETLATCLRLQLLTWWAQYNFGDRNLAPWPVWDTLPPEDATKLADTLSKGADALVKLYGFLGEALEVEELCQRFGIPLVKGVDVMALLAAKKAEADALAAQQGANDNAKGQPPKAGEKPPAKGAEAA